MSNRWSREEIDDLGLFFGEVEVMKHWVRYWAGIIVFLLVTQWNWFSMPFERDEGEYAYAAQLVNDGGVPYRDTYLLKPPMIIHTYRAAQLLSPVAVEPVRIIAFLFVFFTAILIYWGSYQMFGSSTARLAPWIFASLITFPEINSIAANVEKFMILPMMLTVVLYLYGRGRESKWIALLAGACAMAALLYKQIAVAVVGVVFITWGIELFRKKGIRSFLELMFLSMTGAIVLALFAGWSLKAVPQEMLLEQLWLFPKYSSELVSMDRASIVARLAKFLVWWWPLLLLVVGFFVLSKTWRLFLGFLLGAGVLIGLKDVNGHYWVMSVPILAVIAAAGIDKIGRLAEKMDVQGSWHLRIAIACILLLLMPCMGNMVLSPMNLSRKLYGENPFAESACVAQRLAAITTLNDRVYIAGSEPQILVYAQRKSATRFIIAYPLTFPTPLAKKYQNELKSTLASNPPAAIVFATTPLGWGCRPADTEYYQEFLMDFLISGYDQIGGFARTKDGKGAWYDGSFFIDGVPSLKLYKRRIMRNGEY